MAALLMPAESPKKRSEQGIAKKTEGVTMKKANKTSKCTTF
jgi:hypothetical protein